MLAVRILSPLVARRAAPFGWQHMAILQIVSVRRDFSRTLSSAPFGSCALRRLGLTLLVRVCNSAAMYIFVYCYNFAGMLIARAKCAAYLKVRVIYQPWLASFVIERENV